MMALLLNANDSVSRSYSITKPSPLHPIYPSECGERTANLFDGEYPGYAVGSTIQYRPIYVGQGTFTLSTTFPQMEDYGDLFFLAGAVSSGASTGNDGVWSGRPITVESIDGYITIAYRRFTSTHPDLRNYNTMLTKGSTALPYEPYGYQIPLTLGNTTTPIYLGEVQSTRQIKKLVLTGEESWSKSSQAFYSDVIDSYAKRSSECVCSHFPYSTTNGICITLPSKMLKVFESALPSGVTTSDELKTYLAQQYANGTPVTVWYVLATPQTATLNEPLRKIASYADSVSGSNLPTSGQAESLDVGTTLKPSEVSLTYHGWHEKWDKKYTNGSWVENV